MHRFPALEKILQTVFDLLPNGLPYFNYHIRLSKCEREKGKSESDIIWKNQIKGGLGRMSFEGHVILQNEFEVKLKSSQTLSSVLLQFILSATSGFDGAQSPTTDSK